jgi:purine-binding chemotaxis protein CheW
VTDHPTASTQTTYLIFKVDEMNLALPAQQVQEILWLPALTDVPGLPDYVAGVFSLRGQLVPVIDLSVRAGLPSRPYELHHQVIVLEQAAGRVGLLAHAVEDVHTIAAHQILPVDAYAIHATQTSIQNRLGSGMITLATGLAYVIDLATLAAPVQIDQDEPGMAASVGPARLAAQFGQGADSAKRQVWHERAQLLADWHDQEEDLVQIPLAIIRLNNEFFGLELGLVWAIARVQTITPIPCCPTHVLGNMNLRGDILTVVDIRSNLGLARQVPTPRNQNGSGPGATASGLDAMVVVLEHAKVRVGIMVDDVLDIVHLPRSLVDDMPAMSRSSTHNYAIGTILHNDRVMTILDLERILTDGSLEVNDEV